MCQGSLSFELLFALWLFCWVVLTALVAVPYIAIMQKRLGNEVIGVSPAKHAIIVALIGAFLASTAVLTALRLTGFVT